MPIWTPDDGLVTCTSCGATFPPATFPEEQLDRLVDRHDHASLLHEMSLLSRTKALFEHHPDARRVVESIQRRPLEALLGDPTEAGDEGDTDRAAEDEMLARWTEDDPGLREFLAGSTFTLEPRTAFVEQKLRELQQEVDRPVPACPRCGGEVLEFVDPSDE